MKDIVLHEVTTGQEVKEVAFLAAIIWKEHFTPIIGIDQVEYMLEKFQSEHAILEQLTSGYRYFYLTVDEKMAGYSGIHMEENAIFLSKLYIAKEYRGMGLSHKFMDYYESLAKKRQLPAIWLTCNKHNQNTLAVYKKMDFVTIREEKTDIGNEFYMDDFILEKKIN